MSHPSFLTGDFFDFQENSVLYYDSAAPQIISKEQARGDDKESNKLVREKKHDSHSECKPEQGVSDNTLHDVPPKKLRHILF
jgi:hypothetical protein